MEGQTPEGITQYLTTFWKWRGITIHKHSDKNDSYFKPRNVSEIHTNLRKPKSDYAHCLYVYGMPYMVDNC